MVLPKRIDVKDISEFIIDVPIVREDFSIYPYFLEDNYFEDLDINKIKNKLRTSEYVIKIFFSKIKDKETVSKFERFLDINTKCFLFPKTLIFENRNLTAYVKLRAKGTNLSPSGLVAVNKVINGLVNVIDDVKKLSDKKIQLGYLNSSDIYFDSTNDKFMISNTDQYKIIDSNSELIQYNTDCYKYALLRNIIGTEVELIPKNLLTSFNQNDLNNYLINYKTTLEEYISKPIDNLNELQKTHKLYIKKTNKNGYR